MKNILLIISACLLVLVWCGSSAAAAEQYWHVGLDLGVSYDSNVFVSDTNEESDMAYEARPWVEVKKPFGRANLLELKYVLTGKAYTENSDSNSVEHNFSTTISLKGATYYSTITDSFIYSSYPIMSAVSGKNDNWQNLLAVAVGATYNKFGWEAGVGYDILKYPDNGVYDYTEASAFVEANYLVGVNTRVFLTLTTGQINYDDPFHNDADYVDVKLGLKGELTERTTFSIGAGMQSRSYSDDGLLVDNEDYTGLSFDGSLSYKASEKTSVGISLTYKPAEAVSSNYYESLALTISVNHGFTEKISGSAGLSVENGQNPANSVNDFSKFTISTSCAYAIKDWMGLKLEVNYESRNTDAAVGSYDRFTAGIFFTLRY